MPKGYECGKKIEYRTEPKPIKIDYNGRGHCCCDIWANNNCNLGTYSTKEKVGDIMENEKENGMMNIFDFI